MTVDLLTAAPLAEFVPVTVTDTPGMTFVVSAARVTVPVSVEPSGMVTAADVALSVLSALCHEIDSPIVTLPPLVTLYGIP